MNLAGVLAALPTPFDDFGDLDVGRVRRAFPRWVSSPLSGVVVLGTTGEVGLMDDWECDRVVEEARSLVPRDKTLLAGAGRESTGAAQRAARRAAACGADAVLVRTPCWFRNQMTGEALRRHFIAVADASPVPVLLYNFPAATGVTLPLETVAQLAVHPNIVGMKESASDPERISGLLSVVPEDFQVLTGSGSGFYPALRAGAAGGILALAAVLPEACATLFELARERRHDEALRLQECLQLVARLVSTSYGVPGVKAAITLLGTDVGRPRPPLLALSEGALAEIRAGLADFQGVSV